MPTCITEVPQWLGPPTPARKRWTRAECAAIRSLQIWDHERWELVEGDFISKMGKNRPHVNAAWILVNWLIEVFGMEYVQAEAPIDVSHADNETSEPEPDAVVLARPFRSFVNRNPGPDDVRLVAEVSDSSAQFDLTVKAGLYARAGIPEYWVLDVGARRVVVHRRPEHGRYSEVIAYNESEEVFPLHASSHRLQVASLYLREA